MPDDSFLANTTISEPAGSLPILNLTASEINLLTLCLPTEPEDTLLPTTTAAFGVEFFVMAQSILKRGKFNHWPFLRSKSILSFSLRRFFLANTLNSKFFPTLKSSSFYGFSTIGCFHLVSETQFSLSFKFFWLI